MKDS